MTDWMKEPILSNDLELHAFVAVLDGDIEDARAALSNLQPGERYYLASVAWRLAELCGEESGP